MSEMSQKFNDSEVGWYIYDKSRKDRLRHKIWVAKSPPELPAVSTDHETLYTSSFSPHAQPRWNLVDFECICAHGELLIHCNILTMTQTMNHTTSQLMNLYTVISHITIDETMVNVKYWISILKKSFPSLHRKSFTNLLSHAPYFRRTISNMGNGKWQSFLFSFAGLGMPTK